MSLDAITHDAVVVTDRFVLRPMRVADQGLYEMHAGDARVAKMTPSVPHPLPPGAAAALVARANAPDRLEEIWTIDGTPSGASEMMGLISLERMDEKQAEISYWVAPPFWNTGIASDAVSALVDANPMKCAAIFASVFQDNQASARVLMNTGFDYIGDAECFSVARGATVPTWTYIRKLT